MSRKRCSYCGKIIANFRTFCNDDCERNYKNFENGVNKSMPLFKVLIGVAISLMVVGIILAFFYQQLGSIITYIGFGSFIITFIVFPYGTPETFEFLGVKKSLLLVRIVFLIILAVNIFLLIL